MKRFDRKYPTARPHHSTLSIRGLELDDCAAQLAAVHSTAQIVNTSGKTDTNGGVSEQSIEAWFSGSTFVSTFVSNTVCQSAAACR